MISKKSLHVEKISYVYESADIYQRCSEFVLNNIPTEIKRRFDDGNLASSTVIRDISFEAQPHAITGIIGGDRATSKSLIDILIGYRRYGCLAGEVYMVDETKLVGSNSEPLNQSRPSEPGMLKFGYFDNLNFVPRVTASS